MERERGEHRERQVLMLTGNNCLSRNGNAFSVANDKSGRRRKLSQGVHGLLSLVLLEKADPERQSASFTVSESNGAARCIQDDDRSDYGTFNEILHTEAEGHSSNEDDSKGIC